MTTTRASAEHQHVALALSLGGQQLRDAAGKEVVRQGFGKFGDRRRLLGNGRLAQYANESRLGDCTGGPSRAPIQPSHGSVIPAKAGIHRQRPTLDPGFRRDDGSATGELLHFTVRDTGIGLSAKASSRLFQKFSQADSTTTRKYGGTGLGLAISKLLAELMGGTMWAESAGAGQGSTFHFTIAAVRAELPQGKRRDFIGQQPQLAGKRILVVDDNATNRRILALQTAKWGMVVRDTEFPEQALQMLAAEPPMAVIPAQAGIHLAGLPTGPRRAPG